MKRVVLAIAVAGWVGGCSNGDDGAAEVQRCRARSATITTGAYGCVTWASDASTDVGVMPDHAVGLYTEPGATRIEAGATDGVGFYQLAAPPGTYVLCEVDRPGVCSQPVSIGAGDTVAVDLLYGFGVVWVLR